MNVTGNIECKSKAVAEGVKLLDYAQPDWWKHIDLEELDMSGCYSCILGQLYGSYSVGREDLGIPCNEGDLYGFDSYGENQDFATLEHMWRELILSRRAAEA